MDPGPDPDFSDQDPKFLPIRTQEKSPIRIRKKGPGSETLHLGEGKGVRALQEFVKCFRWEPNTVMIRVLILKNKMCTYMLESDNTFYLF